MAVNLGLQIVEWVNRLARRLAAKPDASGIMTIPNRQVVIDTTNEILTKFKKHGVPNDMIRSENDVKVIYNQIINLEDQQLRRNVISPGDPRHKELTEKLLGKKKTTADLIDLGLVRKGKNVKKTTPKEAVDPKLVEEVKVKETFDDFNARQNQTDVVADTVTRIISMEPVAAMKEANKIISRKGIYKNLTKEQSQKILKDSEDWIFQRDPDDLYDYNKKRPFRDDADPEDFAQGGRTGTGLNYLLCEDDQNMRVPYGEGSSWEQFQKEKLMRTWEEYQQYLKNREKEKRQKPYIEERLGTGPGPVLEAAEGGRIGLKKGHSPGRRKFLKVAAGLASIPVVGKFFKWAKPAAKVADVTSVPIKAGADGMPVWFKPLVNRVIKEGTDVTKQNAYKERMVVHKSQLPDSKTDVYVHQDLDSGDVWVDIGADKHGFPDGKFGQPVRLEYKAAEEIEPILAKHMDPKNPKGPWLPNKAQKTKEEFWVEEAEFTGGHPENVKFEESSFNKFGQHESDFSEVEMFAKGKVIKKKPLKKTKDEYTLQKEKGYVDEAEQKFYEGKSSLQKQNEDLADHFSNYPEPDDFASGGRVPLGGGGILKLLKLFKKKPETLKEFIERRNFLKGMIGNTDNMKNKRILQEILEETENVKGFEFPESGVGSDIHKEIEMILNKDVTKHATGGRVPLAGGKKVLEGLAWLANKIAPGSTKIGKTSLPMAPKTELKRAVAGFQEREAAAKLKEMIKNKYQGRIDDDLLNKILVDDNPQRIAEVLATIDEALIMQGKGMGPDQVIQTIKESWKRKPQASGGVAGMLGE